MAEQSMVRSQSIRRPTPPPITSWREYFSWLPKQNRSQIQPRTFQQLTWIVKNGLHEFAKLRWRIEGSTVDPIERGDLVLTVTHQFKYYQQRANYLARWGSKPQEVK